MESVSAKELREQSSGDLAKRILDLQKVGMQERLRTAGQAAKDSHAKRKIRRIVARIKTIMKEKGAA